MIGELRVCFIMDKNVDFRKKDLNLMLVSFVFYDN